MKNIKHKYRSVILISVDALSYKHGKVFSKLFNKTYTQYYTTQTWTLPSHAAMLTGITSGKLFYQKKIKETLKHQKLFSSVPTLATYFKQLGYKTKAITGGGFLSSYFGWGSDWDVWQEALSDKEEWRGEKIRIKDDAFYFLHTYYVHNWFDDVPEIRHLFRENRAELDERKLTQKETKIIKIQGLKAYKNRVKNLFKKLHWISDLGDDVLVVLTSDHGELFFEDGCSFHHGDFALKNRDIFHVPLFFRNKYFSEKTKIDKTIFDFLLARTIINEIEQPIKINDTFSLYETLNNSEQKVKTLQKKNRILQAEIKKQQQTIRDLTSILDQIKSAKTFKLWQKFVKVKKNLLAYVK